jgi:uncharacterized protein YecE (DUF72 family)
MGEVRVGTCSWTDKALVSSGWYPAGARDAAGRLRHYASRFPVVEVDSAFYALPSARTARLWVERTPPDFVFDVKAFSVLTGHATRAGMLPPALRPPLASAHPLRPDDLDPTVVRALETAFLEGVAPLREAGRLGCVLFQFPPWFAPGERSAARLAACRALDEELPLAVEFRHPAWLDPAHREATAALLRRHRMSLVAVDTPRGLPASVPVVAAVTEPRLAVVRFHGRSPHWGTGSKEDRFRHHYRPHELAPWVGRVRALAEEADEVHVLFNNCCADSAVRAAATMDGLLRDAGVAGGAPPLNR